MCSYNQINGTYACEVRMRSFGPRPPRHLTDPPESPFSVSQNSKLINEILKTDLAFEGYVMSDW